MQQLKDDIRSGMPKKQAFDEFHQRGGDVSKAARYLASRPDMDKRIAYFKLNTVLIFLYANMIILSLFASPIVYSLEPIKFIMVVSMALLIPMVLIWYLFQQHAFAYVFLCFFMIKGIADSLSFITISPIAVVISMLVNGLILGLAIYLKRRLFPYQGFFNLNRDSEGLLIFREREEFKKR